MFPDMFDDPPDGSDAPKPAKAPRKRKKAAPSATPETPATSATPDALPGWFGPLADAAPVEADVAASAAGASSAAEAVELPVPVVRPTAAPTPPPASAGEVPVPAAPAEPVVLGAAWPVVGHGWAVDHLRRSIAHGRLRHAYLLIGPDGVGKRTMATALAMALNCEQPSAAARPCGVCRTCRQVRAGQHADLLLAGADGGTLKIEAIRAVMSKLALRPYEARTRVAILDDFHTALPRAQDALLKTLEEAPPTALLVLLATSVQGIMPTIRSRCQTLHLRPTAPGTLAAALSADYGLSEGDADLLARVSGGRYGWAVAAIAEEGAPLRQRDQALNLLEEALVEGRVERFNRAKGLASERPALLLLLALWQSYWRDAVLLAAQPGHALVNVDREAGLRHLAAHIPLDALFGALRATGRALTLLGSTNVNPRLLLEVLFLDYPQVGGAR